MATIGLDKLFYAEITEDSDGNETYGVPASLAKAISADLSVELAEATLYADDGASEIVKEFKSGTLSLGIDDIGNEAASLPISSMPRESVPLLNSLTISEAPSSAYNVASASSTERSAEIAFASEAGTP